MLNPSTADESADDPTIRKVRGFTKRAGYSQLRVVNLFPLRATDPNALWAEREHALGDSDKADAAIVDACTWAHSVVLAWGAHGDRYPERVAKVKALIRASGRPVYSLGTTRSGQPKHPLYISYDVPLRVVEVCRG